MKPHESTPDFELIEGFFFAYRRFISEPDAELAQIGLGRAHHRALYFIVRQPGLTVATLLTVLQIRKQSLNRVLKDLSEQGFILSHSGEKDRRSRHLFASDAGKAFAVSLAQQQTLCLEGALKPLGEIGRSCVLRFFNAMASVEG